MPGPPSASITGSARSHDVDPGILGVTGELERVLRAHRQRARLDECGRASPAATPRRSPRRVSCARPWSAHPLRQPTGDPQSVVIEVTEAVPDDRPVGVIVNVVTVRAAERHDEPVRDTSKCGFGPTAGFVCSGHLVSSFSGVGVGEIECPVRHRADVPERDHVGDLAIGVGRLDLDLQSDPPAGDISGDLVGLITEPVHGPLERRRRPASEGSAPTGVSRIEHARVGFFQGAGNPIALDSDSAVEPGGNAGVSASAFATAAWPRPSSTLRASRSPRIHPNVSQPSSETSRARSSLVRSARARCCEAASRWNRTWNSRATPARAPFVRSRSRNSGSKVPGSHDGALRSRRRRPSSGPTTTEATPPTRYGGSGRRARSPRRSR